MKTFYAAIIAILLTGCAHFDQQGYARDMAQYQSAQAAQRQRVYEDVQPVKLTDHVCVQGCVNTGKSWAYCTSHCSY